MLPEITDVAGGEAEEAILRQASAILCGELEYEIQKRFEIENPTVTLSLDSSDRSAMEITGAHLSGFGSLKEAADYISETLGCPVTIEEIGQKDPAI